MLIRQTVRGGIATPGVGAGAQSAKNGLSGSDQVRASCNPAAPPPERSPRPCSRGDPYGAARAGFWCGVWARGGDWQLNKPANLSSRGRGYRRDLCRYPTQTLGAHRGRKRAAPRAASLNSGSPRERRISASRAPRRAPAPPPPPRRVGTHITDMCAAPPPPPHPLLSYAGRAQAVRRRTKPKRTPFDVAVVTTLEKRDGVPAPQERAQRGARVPDLRPLLPGRRDRGPRGRVRRAGLRGGRARAPGAS